MSKELKNLVDLDLLGVYKSQSDALYAKAADLAATDKKVDGLVTTGGEPNKIDAIKKNGVALVIDSADKSVNVEVPTKTSDLTNDSNFAVDTNYVHTDNNLTDALVSAINGAVQTEADPTVPAWAKTPEKPAYTAAEVGARPNTWTPTAADTGAYTKEQTDAAISDAVGKITQIKYSVVDSLPDTGEAGVIYMVKSGGADPNEYNEYVWSGGRFELIGPKDVDLSGYEQADDITLATSDQVKALFTAA